MNFFLTILLLTHFIFFPNQVYGQKISNPEELTDAVMMGNYSRIDELLLMGVDPSQKDSRGKTPLIYAIQSGSFPLVERILMTQADRDQTSPDGFSPLMFSVLMGRMDLLDMLLLAGADPNLVSDSADKAISALSIALDRGEFSMARRLIQAGADGRLLADPEKINPLNLPLNRVPLDGRMWRGLSQMQNRASSPDWTGEDWALHRAARWGDWNAAGQLLGQGIASDTPDSRGVTPLMAAVWHGHFALVSLLLQHGAQAGTRDDSGWDSLCYAAAAGQNQIIDTLIANMDVGMLRKNSVSLDQSPYYWVLSSGQPGMLIRLINSGFPLPDVDSEGITLLMVASWLSDTFAVRHLMTIVDDAPLMDNAGRTALEWSAAAFDRDRRTGRETARPSRGGRNYEIARLLSRRGRKPGDYRSIVSPDINTVVLESWSPGLNPEIADDWRDKKPSPVPQRPGDGDLILYRIFRDEEQNEPSGVPQG